MRKWYLGKGAAIFVALILALGLSGTMVFAAGPQPISLAPGQSEIIQLNSGHSLRIYKWTQEQIKRAIATGKLPASVTGDPTYNLTFSNTSGGWNMQPYWELDTSFTWSYSCSAGTSYGYNANSTGYADYPYTESQFSATTSGNGTSTAYVDGQSLVNEQNYGSFTPFNNMTLNANGWLYYQSGDGLGDLYGWQGNYGC